MVKGAGSEFVFWSQDVVTKRSLDSGNIRLYNLKESITELSSASINNEGIAIISLTSQADIAVVTQGDDLAIVPINLRYLNTGYDYNRFRDFELNNRLFSFTDRPLYRPGDKIYFKSIVRNEDDVRYSIPTGTVNVVMTRYGLDSPIYDRDLPISSTGSISGEIQLPDNIATGYYSLSFDGSSWENYLEIQVQEFRKPEYFIQIDSNRREYVAGDDINVTIKGEYFSGQPLSSQNVQYKVYATSDIYDYQYYEHIGLQISDDYRYGWRPKSEILSGTVDLDELGRAELSINTNTDNKQGKSQVYSIEIHYQGATVDQASDRINMLVYPGEFGIYKNDRIWSVPAGDDLSTGFKLHPFANEVDLAGRKIVVTIDGEVYEKENRNYYDRKFEKVLDAEYVTNSEGEIIVKFTPEKEGLYKINLKAIDDRENQIIKTFNIYASDRNYMRYSPSGTNQLSLTPDKEFYEPGEQAKVVIYSAVADRDVFLSFDRGRLNRYQVVRMQGNTADLDLPITTTDMPNIYLSAASFGDSVLDWATENIKVSAERMRLQVELSADSDKYGPGDTARLDVETKDIYGNPIPAEVTVWAVDKAIYELQEDPLGNVFNSFWRERGNSTVGGHSLEGITVIQAEGGGCFAAGTRVLMADGTQKNIEDVRVGDLIKTRENPLSSELVNAKVTETSKREAKGYLLINGRLRITDNHVLLVNGVWKEAVEIRYGDILATTDGTEEVSSIEWQLGLTTVYNLEIEDQHTFFADGVYVHNQKGGAAREVLEDTAYWNPSIFTGTDGKAQVTIRLPDNLTTWSVAAVAATSDTRVGQQRTEILVSKDIIIRPIIPNVLREGDEIVLSALAQNFTDEDKVFNVLLEFEEGEVLDPEKENISISSNGTEQVFWNVRPSEITDDAQLRFVMYEVDDEQSGDVIVRSIPVQRFGFKEVIGYSAIGDNVYDVKINPDAVNEQTNIKLNLSSTVLNSLPVSMEYLVDYPYGCIEQTVSRFVPSVIIKQNEDLFPELLKDKDIDEIINKGISKLGGHQQSNGGWGWWYSNSSSFISAYVVEYLLEAESLGYEINDQVMDRARRYFEAMKPENNYDRVTRYYALTLLDSQNASVQSISPDDLNDFLLSMYVIANKKNGIDDKNTNGYNVLASRAKFQGDNAYWDNVGEGRYFASIDATTAMAIRAIISAEGDRDLAVKASQYLARSRNKHYWSNTFATANVIKAVVDLSKTGQEQDPDYSYEVLLDDETIFSGSVRSANQKIDEIVIPAENININGSTIALTKNGTGQMYSTLVVEEFRTDRNYKPEGKALTVTRKIVNARDPYLSLGVGEVADVIITVEGLTDAAEYIVVEDTLPSGMVPVIESFKNEQFEQGNNYFWGKEYKADGVVFSNSWWRGGVSRTLQYRARVVNSGEFWVPPARAEMMYAPEVNGISSIEYMTIDHEPRELPRPAYVQAFDLDQLRIVLFVIAILLSLTIVFEAKTGVLRAKWKKCRSKGVEQQTPSDTINEPEQIVVTDNTLEKPNENEDPPLS